MKLTHKFSLAAALMLGSLTTTAAFGAINDWENEGDSAAFAPSHSSSYDEPAPKSSYDYGRSYSGSRYSGWNFSISGFYAISNDEYVDDVDDSKVDIGGVAVQVNKEFYFGNSPVAFDLGLIAMIGVGESSLDGYRIYTDKRSYRGYRDPDLYVVDALEGVTLGLKFNLNDRVWLGIGAMLGFDYRYAEMDDGYYDDDDASIGYFYGLYGTGNFRVSEHFAITAAVRWLQTSVEFEDDFDGAEKDIGYVAIQLGLCWMW